MKQLLITGVAGFAGSHLLQHIMENTDWNVLGVDSLEHKGDMRRVNEIINGNPAYSPRFTFIKLDLTDNAGIAFRLPATGIDYVANLAAESHVDRSITDPMPFCKNNHDLMLNMLEWARSAKPKVFIQISTDEVYGVAPKGIDHKEWAGILPSNPYSASKAAQEALAISYWRTYNVPIVITNCMNMFGERQDTEKYIPKIMKYIAAGQPVPVHGNSRVIGSRFYLHARNHADALLFIFKNLPPEMYVDSADIVRPSRYNIVGDIEANNLQIAHLVAKHMNKKLKYNLVDYHSTRPGHDRRYALDGTLLKSLGWKPPVDFEDSLAKTIKWTLEHQEWLI